MKEKIKSFLSKFNLTLFIIGTMLLVYGLFMIGLMFFETFPLGSINKNDLLTMSMQVIKINEDDEYFYLKFDLNNSGIILVNKDIVEESAPLYSPIGKSATFMIEKESEEKFLNGDEVYCYTLFVDEKKVFTYEDYIGEYNLFIDGLLNDAFMAVGAFLFSAISYECSLYLMKNKEKEISENDMSSMRQ